MAHVEVDDNGVYHAGKMAMLFATSRELPHAVPPHGSSSVPIEVGLPSGSATSTGETVSPEGITTQPNALDASLGRFGWVNGGIPAPSKDDKYIVEFVGKGAFRIIAYIDGFARVFTTDRPITRPPAVEPDLSLARYDDGEQGAVERGVVQVRSADGVTRRAAEYRFERGSFSITGSWFDFGPYSRGIVLEELITRAYLALVYRPALYHLNPPQFGIGNVEAAFRDGKPLDAFEVVDEDIQASDTDAALVVPGIERCLSRWLHEAGLHSEAMRSLRLAARGNPVRLIRTAKYADMFYLGSTDEEATGPHRKMIWALEAILNRFLLTTGALGAHARDAEESLCAQWDYYLIESVAEQMPAAETPPETEEPVGEWELRCGIARGIESLRLPFRFTGDFRVNAAAGRVAFDLVVPDGSLMPATRWQEGASGWGEVTVQERDAQASRYAMRAAIMVAAIAFSRSRAIERVDVAVRPVVNDVDPEAARGEFPQDSEAERLFFVAFTRDAFCNEGAYRQASSGDPSPFFASFGALIGASGIESPFEDESLSPAWRMLAPEVSDRPLSERTRMVLGIEGMSDLAVNYDAGRRRIGENLADEIVKAETTTERIRLVGAVKDGADDPLVMEGCTRLMVALTDGSIDAGDQNEIVNSFLGDDPLVGALTKAQSIAVANPDAAIDILLEAVAAADFAEMLSGDGQVLCRCFDSYASRTLFNLARRDGRVPQESDKPVKLVPDSLYFCCLEAVKLLERSFGRTEEALRYGKRCMELAPMSGPGYLQTARAYMLVGDMDNTVATINGYLRIAVIVNEIAVAYYQLAYAEWKAGRTQSAIAGYLKAMSLSPVAYDQSKLELEELLRETKSELIAPGELDGVLQAAGIAVAPAEDILDQLLEASAAAIDAELFVVARSVLSAYCQFKPDDALVSVLRSLGD